MSELLIESLFEINGQIVYYEKFGSGPKTLLLIPDAIGTGRSDFMDQLDGEDALDFDEFTLIAVDAPGWGRSRPLDRKYGADVYNTDCQCFYQLMQHLGRKQFSVIGWGEGAKTALLMAIKYPARVQSIVLIGISYYNTESALKHMNSMKSVDKWSEERLECYLRVYESKEEIQTLWTKYCRFFCYFNQYFSNDLFKNQYKAIKCPALLLHNEMDPLTDLRQIVFINKNIANSKLHRMVKGDHDYHLQNPDRFKRLVEEFLLKAPDDESTDSPFQMTTEGLA